MFIERKEYMAKLISFKDKKLIKIVTGIRRCGKSTLLAMYRDYLKTQGVDENQIIFLNFEDIDNEELTDYKKLHAYVKERMLDGKMLYVFLDEIQNVRDFQKAVDSLYIRDNIDIYVTGSNSNMLSSEIATLLSGRYVNIHMLPLSFSEYVQSTGDNQELKKKYFEYMEKSSFPYALNFTEPDALRQYLEDIYNTIIVKDIVEHNNIRDILMLKSILRFIFDNIGSPLSINKIANTLTSNGRKIDVKTVEKYLYAFLESYIVYQAKRYDVKGKQFLKSLDKYYVVDIGMRYMMLGTKNADTGHILENIVYLELLRRGYDVYVGKVDNVEIDFVAQKGKEVVYFQVAASILDSDVLDRELRPLRGIDDNFPKYILTLDEIPDTPYDGIVCTNVLNWLIEGK